MTAIHHAETVPYSSNIHTALAVLAKTDLWRYSYAPPLHRLLWRAGIQVPPPHLATIVSNVCLFSPWLCIVWGTFTWYAFFSSSGVPLIFFVVVALFTGVACGFGLAILYQESSRKRGLPVWADIKWIAHQRVLNDLQDGLATHPELTLDR